mmetsp:Transcript_31376/g.66819  ORF Transcript_31376/g.66819 Transcript_31376/m.66819 type:complete len:365 (+) Transcript_31376:119-1213(+)
MRSSNNPIIAALNKNAGAAQIVRTSDNMFRPKNIALALLLCLLFGNIMRMDTQTPPTNPSSKDNGTPSPTATPDSIQSWSSDYEVDCNQLATSLRNEEDDGMFVQTRTDPLFLMNIHSLEDGLSKEIHEKGCWECRHVKNLLKVLGDYPDAIFLDIGGNIGMWSLSAAAADHPTFTIEALSANIKRLCKSVHKNPVMAKNTHIMHVAATAEPETFKFDVPKGNMGGVRVVAVGRGESTDGVEVIRGVPIDSLDLPTDRPVVLKIDVEGHELQALWGAIKFLQKADIVYAAMELRPRLQMESKWRTIFDIFEDKELIPWRINYEGMGDTMLDVEKLEEWKHFKHPIVRYYDVVWRKVDYVPVMDV